MRFRSLDLLRIARPVDLHFRPDRIVSGGQTGVDRGALDAGRVLGIAVGGWCPRGRLAEDGVIPDRYPLVELASSDYVDRTERNVIDSDATLILYENSLSGGTLLTKRIARRLGRPCLAVRLGGTFDPRKVRRWVDEVQPATLNIAGPRASSHPGIADRACAALLRVFRDPQQNLPLEG